LVDTVQCSKYNGLDQYSSVPNNTGNYGTEWAVCSVVMDEIISTHCGYLWRDGQAKLAWMAGSNTKHYTNKMITRLSADWIGIELLC